MRRPIIVITTSKQVNPSKQSELQAVGTGCNIHYVEAISRGGGVPLLLPRMRDTDAVRYAIDAADGVLLTGGGDVTSQEYEEEPHPAAAYQDPVRDALEREVIRVALEKDLPILGICRGVQMLNVARGGTLVQDIPSQVKGAVRHFSQAIEPLLLHKVDVEEGTLLAGVLGGGAQGVNSYHHQAVKEVGAGLRVNCRARDGVIEGLESSDGKPILAVQFHPEEMAATYAPFQALFNWLIGAAGQRSR